ncbi:transient receptor potential cation channel subfamily M member 8-like [Saccoglossus kowalevskii]
MRCLSNNPAKYHTEDIAPARKGPDHKNTDKQTSAALTDKIESPTQSPAQDSENKNNDRDSEDKNKALDSENKNKALDSEEKNKALDSEEKNKALDSEEKNKALDSENKNKALDSEEKNKALDSEEKNKALDSEEKNKALDSEEKSKTLVSENKYKALESGDQNKALDSENKNNALESGDKNNALDSENKNNAPESRDKNKALDSNHTHFILVDGGSEKCAIDLRDKLEGSIPHIPKVVVVIGGDERTLEMVHDHLEKKDTTFVIVKGSGGAADTIADVNTNAECEEDIAMKSDKSLKWLTEIRKQENRERISVIDMNKPDGQEFVRTIVQSILKGLHGSEEKHLLQTITLDLGNTALETAITNVRSKKGNTEWEEKNLTTVMEYGLIKNKIKLIDLYFDESKKFHKFLKKDRLSNLYIEVIRDCPNNALNKIIKRLLEKKRKHWEKEPNKLKYIAQLLLQLTQENYDITAYVDKDAHIFKQPDQHLFIWAVLFNRYDIAICFWERLEVGNIGSALIGGKLLKTLAEHAEIDGELLLQEELTQNASKFEDLATVVINYSYGEDRRFAKLALVRQLPDWGDTTCLAVASAAKQMTFMEQECCQSKLNRVWNGNLQFHSAWQWIQASSNTPTLKFMYYIPLYTHLSI